MIRSCLTPRLKDREALQRGLAFGTTTQKEE